MVDINGIVTWVLMPIVLILLVIIKLGEFKKKKAFFDNEISKLDFGDYTQLKYKRSSIIINEYSDQIALIYFNKEMRLFSFQVDYYITTPMNRTVIIIDADSGKMKIFFQEEDINREYFLQNIRNIEIFQQFDETEQSVNKVKELGIKIYFYEVMSPFIHINFLYLSTSIQSVEYNKILKVVETTTESLKVLVHDAKEKNIGSIGGNNMTNVSYNINNVYGSMIGHQEGSTVNNKFSLSMEHLDKLVDENGGDDKEILKQLLAEIKKLQNTEGAIEKGSLLKYSHMLEKHSWLSGALAQIALGWLVGK